MRNSDLARAPFGMMAMPIGGACACTPVPDGVSAAIRHHHDPAHCDDEQADMIAIVAMANFLCTLHGLTSLGVRNVPEPPDEVIDRLQLGPDAIRSFKDQFQETLAQATIMAGV